MLGTSHQRERTIKGCVKYSRENCCASLVVEQNEKSIELNFSKQKAMASGGEWNLEVFDVILLI